MKNLKEQFSGITFDSLNSRPDIIEIITEALHQSVNYLTQYTGPDAARIIRQNTTPGDVWTAAADYSRKYPEADGITAILHGAAKAARKEGLRHRPESLDRDNDGTESGTYSDTIPDPETRTENAEIMIDLSRIIPAAVMEGIRNGNSLYTSCREAGLTNTEYQQIRRNIAKYKAD